MRNSLDFEQGKAFQKAEIMLQVENIALWTGISGGRLKVSRSLLHLKKTLPPKGSSLNLKRRTNLEKGDTIHSSSWKNNPGSKTWCKPKKYIWKLIPGFHCEPEQLVTWWQRCSKGNLSHSVLAEWECSAELHTEWKHKQQSAFRQKNPLLHWGWGGKGEKAAGWSFVEPKGTNRSNKLHCFRSSYSSDISSSHPPPVTNTATAWNRTRCVAKEVTKQILPKTSGISSGAGIESFYSIQEATGRLNHATKRTREDRNKKVTESFLPWALLPRLRRKLYFSV